MKGGLRILFLLGVSFLLASGVAADSSSYSETNNDDNEDATDDTNDETENTATVGDSSNSTSEPSDGGEPGGEPGREPSEVKCFIKGGYKSVKAGEIFRHPRNKCIACRCCENGKYTCRMRKCPSQPCGINKQTTFSEDGCCKECCDECTNATCQDLTCPYQAYPQDSCCKTCGCLYNGVNVPLGPFGHVCEQCVCLENNIVKCNRPACPSSRLECINPTFDDPATCNYICPDGEFTCRRSDMIVPEGTLMARKNKICTCNSDSWYTRAFCSDEPDLFKYLEKYLKLRINRCMANHNLPSIVANPLLGLQGPGP